MLNVSLKPEFRAGAVRSLRAMAPAAESLRLKLFKGASTAMVGAILGWGAVVGVGGLLVSGASHDPTQSAPAPAPTVTAVVASPAPAAAAAPAAPKQATAAPVPAPAPTKVTQRVDMSPTAAISDPPKPHKKPHKKKPLDNAN